MVQGKLQGHEEMMLEDTLARSRIGQSSPRGTIRPGNPPPAARTQNTGIPNISVRIERMAALASKQRSGAAMGGRVGELVRKPHV